MVVVLLNQGTDQHIDLFFPFCARECMIGFIYAEEPETKKSFRKVNSKERKKDLATGEKGVPKVHSIRSSYLMHHDDSS